MTSSAGRLSGDVFACALRTLTAFACILGLQPVSADSIGGFPLLRESFDPRLQRQLEGVVGDLGLDTAVNAGKLGVALVDISDPADPRMASLNGDEMFYAASLPKIAILLGAFVQIESGAMALDEPTQRSLTEMIRVSSNKEATRMLRRVGKQNLINILRSERYRLYDPLVNGGLWVGKEYAGSSAYQRDPLHNLSHGATALQTARFYYLLETGRLVDPALAPRMKRMLGKPGINHKFVKGLEARPEAVIYRKSGSWRHWHADSALVEANGRKYILVALAEDRRGGRWLEQLITPLHDIIVPQQLVSISN